MWKERLPLWKIKNFLNMRIMSVNSESDSELEEGKIDPQPDLGPARQQPAQQQPAGGEIWMSKNCEIEWSSCPRNDPPNMAAKVIRMQPGTTQMVVTHMCRT